MLVSAVAAVAPGMRLFCAWEMSQDSPGLRSQKKVSPRQHAWLQLHARPLRSAGAGSWVVG